MRAAHDSSFCGRSQGDFAPASATKGLSDRLLETFGPPTTRLVSNLTKACCGRGLFSVMRAAHDGSFCGRSQGGGFPIAPATPSGAHLLIDWYRGNNWQVAAALSAAVITTKLIRRPTALAGARKPKGRDNSNPSYSSGEGAGGEALLLEKRPLPQNLRLP